MLAEHEMVCPSCGALRSECSDPTRDWYPQRTMCYATAVRESVIRRVREKHKDAKPQGAALHPLEGMTIWVSEYDLSPDDNFV